MDAMVRMAGDWQGVLVGFVWVILVAGIAPLLALAVAVLATALVRWAQTVDGVPAAGRRGPLEAWREWDVPAAPEPVPTPAPGAAVTGPLSAGGRPPVIALSSTEVIVAGAPRERLPAHEAPGAPERLAFARWLVEHGRLSE